METRIDADVSLPPPPNTLDNLTWLEECVLCYDRQIARLEGERRFYGQLLESMKHRPSGNPAQPSQAGERSGAMPPATSEGVPDDTDLTWLTVDLDGAESNSQKVFRVVEAAQNRLLNTMQVGLVLRRSGMEVQPRSAQVAAKRIFESSPALFEPVPGRKGVYLYTGKAMDADTDDGGNQPDPGNINQEG